jgi:hypothetical protein
MPFLPEERSEAVDLVMRNEFRNYKASEPQLCAQEGWRGSEGKATRRPQAIARALSRLKQCLSNSANFGQFGSLTLV